MIDTCPINPGEHSHSYKTDEIQLVVSKICLVRLRMVCPPSEFYIITFSQTLKTLSYFALSFFRSPLPAVDPEGQAAGYALYTMVVALGMVLLIFLCLAYWKIKLIEGETLPQESERWKKGTWNPL